MDPHIGVSVGYTGVDPSGAMLNELVRKHALVAAAHPMTFAEAQERSVLGGTKFDVVLALGGSASYLTAADLAALPSNWKGAYLLTAYGEGRAPVTGDLNEARLHTGREQLRAFATDHHGRIERVGRFEVALPSR